MGGSANFVVENVNGSLVGANKGVGHRRRPTLLLPAHPRLAAACSLYRKLRKPLEDFEYLGMINEVPMTLIGKPTQTITYRVDLEEPHPVNAGKLNIVLMRAWARPAPAA
jgi:tripartite-type tricarboxylate transporter receptor subunit TctC